MTGITDCRSYLEVLSRTMRGVVSQVVDQIAAELLHAYCNDRTVFVFGNGGSAATASHFVCDLAKGTAKWLGEGDRRFRVVALTDNVPLITAWGNDSAYEEIFAEQLRNLVRRGDVVVAISGSGNSPNILNALQVAKRIGAVNIGLTGFQGGQMRPLCRHCVVIPSENMEIIEDIHLAVCHSLSTVIRTSLLRITSSNVPLTSSLFPAASAVCSDSGTRASVKLRIVEPRVDLHPVMGLSKRDITAASRVDAD